MSANVNAQLGLIITASDNASPIFEALARNIMNAFAAAGVEARGLQETLGRIGSGVNLNESVSGLNAVGQEAERTTAKTESLRSMFSRMAQISALQDLGARFQNTGRQVTGFFTRAIEDGASFQQQVQAIAATLNSQLSPSAQLSSQQIDVLNQKALTMGQQGYFSANQIAESMYTLARQGIQYKDIMGGAMSSIQDLSVATDSDLNSTANVVSDIIHEMGGELSKEFGSSLQGQFQGVSDAISGAMHNARMSMNDFLNTLKYVGPQASSMGMGIKDVSTAIALLGEHGIKSSQAGTTLRRMLTNLAAPTKAATSEMEQLGIITKDGGNEFFTSAGKLKSFGEIQAILADKTKGLSDAQKEVALKTIFGQYALAGMNVIVNASADDIKHLNDMVSKSGTAHELAAKKWTGAAGDIRRLQASFETMKKEIGEQLLPVAILFMEQGQKLIGWFNQLNPTTKEWVVRLVAVGGIVTLLVGKIMSFAASIGMMRVAFGNLFQAEQTAQRGATVAAEGVEAVSEAAGISSLALGGIVIAVAAVGIGLYELYQHSETFRDGVNAAFKAVVDFLKKDIFPLFIEIWGKIKEFIAAVMPDIKTIITEVVTDLKQDWTTWWPVFSAVTKFVFGEIMGNIKVVLDAIMGIIRIALALIAGDWGGAWNGLKTMTWNIINDILGIFGTSGDKLLQAGKNLIQSFVNGWKNFHIPMPHFNIAGKFSLNPPSLPSVGVNWYAGGGIFSSPQVIGVGESGTEAVLPLNKLANILNLDKIIQGAASTHGKQQINNITVNVQGHGKNDKDLANDIARRVRLQMNIVSI